MDKSSKKNKEQSQSKIKQKNCATKVVGEEKMPKNRGK
jgi:hypothetical protein